MDEVLIRVSEAARMLGVCEATIRRAIHEGKLQADKGTVNSPWRIRLNSLLTWAGKTGVEGATVPKQQPLLDDSLIPDEGLVLDETGAVAPKRHP